MRKTKFRGKVIEKMVGEQWMTEGYGVHVIELIKGPDQVLLLTSDGNYLVHAESVGQFLGVTDKDGVEIFEGDIVQPYNREKKFYKIVYKDSGFYLRYQFKRKYKDEEWIETTHIPLFPDSYRVVGNTFDNPELLEVK